MTTSLSHPKDIRPPRPSRNSWGASRADQRRFGYPVDRPVSASERVQQLEARVDDLEAAIVGLHAELEHLAATTCEVGP